MDGYVTIDVELGTKSFDEEIKQTQKYLDDLVVSYEKASKPAKGFKRNEEQLAKMRLEIEKTNNKLSVLNQKQKDINKNSFANIGDSIDNIGNSISRIIKKVTRWGLAVFGIRSAYLAVRQAMSTISQYDEQLATDIEYMKNALAFVLEPVVRAIVNLMKQLMFYVGYIVKAWTGKNIFENANKSLKGANKQAKQLSKTMAGFDEMNVLSDTSGGATGGGGVSPSFDLSGIEDFEPPRWLIIIKDIGQWIIDNWQQVLGLLLLTKLFIDILTGNWIGVIIDIIGFIILAIPQITKALGVVWDGLVEFFKWIGEKIVWVFTHIEEILAGIGHAIGNIVQFIINLFVGAIKFIIDAITNGFKFAFNFIKDIFNGIVNFFSGIINKILTLFKAIGTKVGEVLGGAFKGVINGVLGAIESILNTPIKTINSLIKTINKVPGINLGTLNTFKLPRLAKGGIINQPGRGVMIGGAIAGERGKEGVIPLTDSQQMALLGEAIGKYITINANITNTMNGRVISRELQRVQNTNDFAFNR